MRFVVPALWMLSLVPFGFGQETKPKVYVDASKADADFQIQGEYEGRIGKDARAGAQLVALGDGKFEGAIYAKGLPGGGWDRTKVPLKGETKGPIVVLTGTNFTGRIEGGKLLGTLDDAPL